MFATKLLSFIALSFFVFTTHSLNLNKVNRIRKTVRRDITKFHMMDTEIPDNADDLSQFHPHNLREHPEKTDASSLLESEVCDYGILTALAEEHVALGNYDEAMKLAKSAIETAEHTREVNNVYSAYAEGIWGDALYNKGEYQESADHYHGALKSYERHYRSQSGPEAVELVGAVNLAAWNLLSKKDYEEATAAWSTALGMTERLLGPKNTDVAGCMTNLAISHMNMGDIGAAPEALLKKALLVYEEKKMMHFDTKNAKDQDEPIWKLKSYLGNLHYLRGDDEQAADYLQSVEEAYNMGDIEDVKVAKALEKYGIIQWRKGHTVHATKLFEDAIHVTKTKVRTAEDMETVDRLKIMLQSVIRGGQPPPVVNNMLIEE